MLTQGLFEPEVELKWRATRPGMAHFAGTGPAETTCEDCHCLNLTSGKSNNGRCLKYEEITKRRGPSVDKWALACRYFARRP